MPASDAGIGDPYWYEWSVGLRHVIAMLNPDSGIVAVTLQAMAAAKGLDDVHVHFASGTTRVIQVKHTREESSFTFGDLVGSESGESLVEQLSKAWIQERSRLNLNIEAVEIHTNRRAGLRSHTITTSSGRKILRPVLADFWREVKAQVSVVSSLHDVNVPSEMADGWHELASKLAHLNDSDALTFLKQLEINTDQPNLKELKQELLDSLSATFGTTPEQSLALLKQLDHALRRWATTERGASERLTSESVFQELSSRLSVELSNEHFFPPPEPFFSSRIPFITQLESIAAKSRIVFLRGLPGAGKTSVISQLANRPFPVVTLRYHAFRPLSPSARELSLDASDRVTPLSFWRELLDQLRVAFRGKLAINRVPIRSDFLTLQQLRTEVLRLSARLSEITGTRVVVAIDGIDHAARAASSRSTFLETLPDPEDLPSNVGLLIAGQPASAYPSYPSWVRDPPTNIAIVDLPELSDDDIGLALAARNTALATADIPAAVRMIAAETQRNTLAVVFAVEESRTCRTLQELTERLKERRLRSDVNTYYEALWQGLQSTDPSSTPRRLCAAAALSLLTVRVSPEMLAGAFGDIEPNSEIWAHLLTRMQPLIVREPSGFRVLHNDVRVFLTRRLQEYPEEISRLTSRLARYSVSAGAPAMLRHSDAFRLLALAGLNHETATLFTPSFVLEGCALERATNELAEQGKAALRAAVATGDRRLMHSVACGLQTFSRILGTERERLSEANNVPPVLPAERSVAAPSTWSLEVIRGVLQDIELLVKSNEHDRARGLLRRWFGQITPLYFVDKQVQDLLEQADTGVDLEREVPELLREWGRLSSHLLPISELFRAAKGHDDLEDSAAEALASFLGGWGAEVLPSATRWMWCRALRRIKPLFIADLERLVRNAATAGRYDMVLLALRQWARTGVAQSRLFQAEAAFWSCKCGDQSLAEFWLDQFCLGEKSRESDTAWYMEQGIALSRAATATAYLMPARPLRGIVEDVARLNSRLLSEDEMVVMLRHLHVAAAAGRMLRVSQGRTRMEAATDALDAIKRSLKDVLLEPLIGVGRHNYRLDGALRGLADVVAQCARTIGSEVASTVRLAFLAVVEKSVTAEISETVWVYLTATGDHGVLQRWAERILGAHGIAWNADQYSRSEIIYRFARLSRQLGQSALASYAEDRHRYTPVFYRDHKEYSVQTPHAWFQAAQHVGANLWPELTLRLLMVSKEADRHGGNRFELEVESAAIAAALHAGPGEYLRLRYGLCPVDGVPWVLSHKPSLVDGVIAFLEKATISPSELKALWAACVGSLAWQRDTERSTATDLCTAVVRFSDRVGSPHLLSELKQVSPAEFTFIADREKHRFPRRWFEGPFRYSRNESESAWMSMVATLSFDRAIVAIEEAYASKTVGDSVAFDALADWAIALRRERPPTLNQLVNQALSFLSSRRYRYPWHIDGSGNAFSAIGALLSPAHAEIFINIILDQIPFESSIGVWVETAGENFDDMLRATAHSSEAILEGLNATLSMHEAWRTGGGRYRQEERVNLQLPPVEVQTWDELAVAVLLPLLSDPRSATVEAASRGLTTLLRLRAGCSRQISMQWGTFNDFERERLLAVLEAIASFAPSVLATFERILQSEYRAQSARHSLQAWVCLDILRRHMDAAEIPWPPELLVNGQFGHLAVFGPLPQALEVKPQEDGLFAYSLGSSGLKLLLSTLERIAGEPVADLESRIFSVSHPPESSLQERRGWPGEVTIQREERSQAFDYHVMAAARSGRWKSIPTVQIAQAALYADDPLVVASAPLLASSTSFLMDDELESAYREAGNIEEGLARALRTDLPAGWVVIGGTVETFSSRRHVRLNETLGKHTEIGSQQKWGGSPSGRSFAYHHLNRVQSLPPGFKPLFLRCGGLAVFSSAMIMLAPSFMMKEAGFSPDKGNPLIWRSERGDEVRLELRFVNRERPGGAKHHPTIQRWVCRQPTLELLNVRLGALTVERMVEVASRTEK